MSELDDLTQRIKDQKVLLLMTRRGYRVDISEVLPRWWCCTLWTFNQSRCYRATTRTEAIEKANRGMLSGDVDESAGHWSDKTTLSARM
jgi:hypothetical protein